MWEPFLTDLLRVVKNLAPGFFGVCLASFFPSEGFFSFTASSLIFRFFPGPFPGVSAAFGVSDAGKAFLFFPRGVLGLGLFVGDFFPVACFSISIFSLAGVVFPIGTSCGISSLDSSVALTWAFPLPRFSSHALGSVPSSIQVSSL